MIMNVDSKQILSVLAELYNHPIAEFWLTGSRHFGFHHPSDWDFFAENNRELTTWLFLLGFKKTSMAYQEDPNIAEVWRFNNQYEVGIDVQLVSNVNKKLAAQKLVEAFLRNKALRDLDPKKHWLMAYAMLELENERLFPETLYSNKIKEVIK